MRLAVLLFNPTAGRRGTGRKQLLDAAAETLQRHGVQTQVLATHARGTAGVQAAEAIARGADTIFACGGDGTLHEVLQGVAHSSSAAVGILPLGSANAMARHLRLSLNPVEAARQQLAFEPRTIPLGRVTFQTNAGERSRLFVVMAGAGPDGMLVYNMLATGKHTLGRSSYYMRAARLFLARRFSSFEVTATVDGSPHKHLAVSAMAIRVGDLGGLFSQLGRGASPDDKHLHLALTAPPAYIGLPAWFAMSWVRLERWNPYSKRLQVDSFTCSAGSQRPVHVQADGEWLGYTPMRVDLVPNTLRLLMPTSPKAR